jgi:rare lipoprotein A
MRKWLLMIGASLAIAAFTVGALAHHRVIWGKAVYYADHYAGDTMACGGKYQTWKMVAAHRKLPCGTRLRVKNRANGRKVTVTVRDRGPYGDDSIKLDLSKRAARRLGYLRQGVAKIKAVVLHD